VRAAEFTPQLEEPKRATSSQIGWGLSLIVIGLFEKLVVADYLLAPIADSVYNSGLHPNMISAWVGTLAFAGQIFCDFSGYSMCAIGAALCLGFAFPDNFHFPYASVGFSDFWKRWHMSLSRWLRDYLYIPLGGNRKGPVRTHVNLMLTMLLGGLWHGASWTFVIWGGLHGVYLVGERLLRSAVPNRPWAAYPAVRLALSLITFALVCFTWVFFRARTWDAAWGMSSSMLGLGGSGATLVLPTNIAMTAGVMLTLLIAHWNLKESSYEALFSRLPWWVRSTALAVMMVLIVLTPGEDRAFIYFQF
jgi:D-alanyl-lipoteichoic acid acyltransferase DltB (MBOAT superfamily)